MICPGSHPIKGNFTTYSGERCIYHVPGGGFYGKTRPEQCYASETDETASFTHRGALDTFSVVIRGAHMTKEYKGPQRRRKTHGACVNSGRIPPPSYILGNKPPKFAIGPRPEGHESSP